MYAPHPSKIRRRKGSRIKKLLYNLIFKIHYDRVKTNKSIVSSNEMSGISSLHLIIESVYRDHY